MTRARPPHALPLFRHCPRCAHADANADDGRVFHCRACDFRYYHNVAAAVAALIVHDDCLLVTRRAHAPAAGLLDLPGGFVDPGEGAEQALLRELGEELGWQPDGCTPRFVCTRPNTYLYAGVRYATCDLFFRLDPARRPVVVADAEIAGWSWTPLAALDPHAFGFDSVRSAVASLARPDSGALVDAAPVKDTVRHPRP